MASLGIFLTALLVSCVLTWLASQQNQKVMINLLKGQLDAQEAQVKELLNRIQAADFKTFAALQGQTKPAEPQYDVLPRSDQAELYRMAEMYGDAEGLGDTIYSEEEQELFGLIPDFSLDGELR